MLRELSVQNLALIEDVHVELEEGYCAWTGETGAGKSLLLTALGLVLGGKASADLIRSGKTEARAAAVFEIADRASGPRSRRSWAVRSTTISLSSRGDSRRRDAAAPRSTGCRSPSRRSRSWASYWSTSTASSKGVPCSTRTANASCSMHTVDSTDAFAPIAKARQAHEALRRKRQALLDSAAARRRERALLEFERDELAAADPRPGEYDELARKAHRLKNAEQIRTAAAAGYSFLYEADRSAQDLLTRVARSLEPLTQAAPELAEAASALERLADETREVAFTLRDLGQGWDDSPARLEDLETRMALYRRLAARFHCTPDELALRREAIDAKLSELDLE